MPNEYNLLSEPLLGVRRAVAVDRLTLPGVLAALGKDDVESFTGLQAHQAHAWHAFMVQLAAIALHAADETDVVASEDVWAARLRALTQGRDEAWTLVVADLGQPAFMQPPVPEGSLAGFKNEAATPDAIDVLVTSKNHDVKRARMGRARPEHWAYALVSLQTMAPFAGRDTYGIARMNGGFGSRPGVGFAPGASLGDRFRRDAGVVLASRAALVDGEFGYAPAGGRALLWAVPWDGKASLALGDCDPYFIEICRRVRLTTGDGGAIVARLAPTKVPRVAAKELKGSTGDPWTPVWRDENSALTLGAAGFTYSLVQELLLGGDVVHGAAGQPAAADDGATCEYVATALAGGQGGTNGLHMRRIPIPATVRRRLGVTAERDRLAALAKHRVERTAAARQQVLKPALCALLQAAPERIDFKDDRPARWTARLDAAVDRVFFDRLWADADLRDEDADRHWSDVLHRLARAELEDAIGAAPVPAARRYRAIAAAERVFAGAWRKQFGPLDRRESDEVS